MADVLSEKPEGEVDDVLELTPEQIVPEGEGPPDGEPEGEDEEVLISIGDEAAPASDSDAPEWVRDLRKRNRELERKVAELEKPGASVPELGPKPTLESCDYDEAAYEEKLDGWHAQKRTVEAAKSEATKAEETARERWNAKLGTYAQQKDTLPVQDFDAAEAEVTSLLSPQQQAILIQGAERKAEFVYALGKHPEQLRKLAAIQDPVEFAFAAARLEGQTKMVRKPRTQPEGRVQGSAPLAGSTDKTLERLEKDASKPGADRTELIRYKKAKGLL